MRKINKFYHFKKDKEVNELYVYGQIIGGSEKWSEDDVTFKDFKDALEQIEDGAILNMYINSPGGSIFATQSIVAILKRAKNRSIAINAFIDGLGASCASWLPCIADNLYIYKQSVLMMHKPMSMAWGNADDMRNEIEVLDKLENDVIIPLYLEMAQDGVTAEQLKEKMQKETWLTAADITALFKAELLEDTKEIICCVDEEAFKNYKNIPQGLKRKINKNEKEKLQLELDLLRL